MLTLYNTLTGSYINYGLLVWRVESNRIEVPQKKAIRHVTSSTYFAHTTPLFKSEGLLKVYDILKAKFLKFFYKLPYDLLPPYFNSYYDDIDKETPRVLRQHFIHQTMIKRAYAECNPFYQLIKLINMMRNDLTDSILITISENNRAHVQLSYYIKKSFLNA